MSLLQLTRSSLMRSTISFHAKRVLLSGTRVVSGRQAVLFASRYIAYDLGEPLSDEELESLRDQYVSHFGPDELERAALPDRTFSAE